MRRLQLLCLAGALILTLVMLVGRAHGQAVNPANGHTYFNVYPRVSIFEARKLAALVDGYVVSINDAAEGSWVADHMSPSHPWLGLSDEVTEGTFLWDSGEPLVYTDWSGGQAPTSDSMDYVYIDSYGWRNSVGGIRRQAVIETPEPLGPPVMLPSPEEILGTGVLLDWSSPIAYSLIFIYRDLKRVAILPGSATSYLDPFGSCNSLYTVMGVDGSTRSVPRSIRPIACCDDACYSLRIPGMSAREGDTIDVPILFNYCESGLYAYTIAVCYDAAGLQLLEILDGAAQLALPEPMFLSVVIDPGVGFGISVAYDFATWIYSDICQEMHVARLEVLASAPDTVPLEFCDGIIGTPWPFVNTLWAGGQSVSTALYHGSVQIVAEEFIRGDCNGDGAIDIADVPYLGHRLFGAQFGIPCMEACESNGDGELDIADMVYTISYLFYGGPAPSTPFPECGVDPLAASGLGCEILPACP